MRAYRNRRDLQKLQQQGSPSQLFGANMMDNMSHQGTASLTEPSTITDASYPTTTDKIDAIANATLESGQQMLLLAQENDELRQQVSKMQTILGKMQTTLDDKDNSSQPPSKKQSQGKRSRNPNPRGFDTNSKHYCWTHDLTRTPYHTSKNCREPEPNHKRDATFTNRMKGNSYKCHLANSATQEDTKDEEN